MGSLFVDSVIKSYGYKQLLTDVFLSCSEGEIVGLFGRNGVGKSTLLKIVFGSLLADQKFVKIENQVISGISENQNLIKYLPQEHFLPTHIKIKQIVDLFCSSKSSSELKGIEMLKPFLERKPKSLSGGERRLIEILIVIYSEAKYVLLDEPFKGIDPLHQEIIKTLIKEQSKEKGFIITDHDYRNVLDISTRIISLQDGGIKSIKEI